jgi:Yip1 domain
MVNKFFVFVVKDIIINPLKTWESTDSENRSVSVIRNLFLFPLILLVSVSAFAGSLIYTNSELSPVFSVFVGIKCFILFYITVFATSFILKEITYPLDLGRNFGISFRLISYSVVPLLLCQILSRIFESLLFVNVLALFGLYILWTGIEKMLSPPVYKKIPLLIATFISFTGIFFATDFLFTKLINKIYYAFFS